MGMQNTQASYPRVCTHESQSFSTELPESKGTGSEHLSHTFCSNTLKATYAHEKTDKTKPNAPNSGTKKSENAPSNKRSVLRQKLFYTILFFCILHSSYYFLLEFSIQA
jgi:hypothetical protein